MIKYIHLSRQSSGDGKGLGISMLWAPTCTRLLPGVLAWSITVWISGLQIDVGIHFPSSLIISNLPYSQLSSFISLGVVDAQQHNVLRSAQDQAVHKGRFPPAGGFPGTQRPVLVA